jgi:hypothetical protein
MLNLGAWILNRFGPTQHRPVREDQARDQVRSMRKMPKAKCLFRETEVTRAVKAAEKTGKKVSKFEIDTAGKIIVFFGGDDGAAKSNPWDD